jgi:hypothetical protein
MCDYSLCGLPTRLAAEGEELVVHRFRTGSMGLASPAELCPPDRSLARASGRGFWKTIKSVLFEDVWASPNVRAICVPPGAQLVVKSIPHDLQRRWSVGDEESVSFVQISASVYSYRDAIRFGNGLEVLLQNIPSGIRVYVQSLGNASFDIEKELAALTPRA